MTYKNCHPVNFLALLIVVLLTTSVQADDVHSLRSVNGHMCSAGELLVKFREGVSPQAADTVHRVLKVSEWRQGL